LLLRLRLLRLLKQRLRMRQLRLRLRLLMLLRLHEEKLLLRLPQLRLQNPQHLVTSQLLLPLLQ
jgi:hypothetical protein